VEQRIRRKLRRVIVTNVVEIWWGLSPSLRSGRLASDKESPTEVADRGATLQAVGRLEVEAKATVAHGLFIVAGLQFVVGSILARGVRIAYRYQQLQHAKKEVLVENEKE
jgi:hypothetical protein